MPPKPDPRRVLSAVGYAPTGLTRDPQLQEIVAEGSSLWLLRQTEAHRTRCPRPQDLGVRNPGKREDHLGGRSFQDDRDLP